MADDGPSPARDARTLGDLVARERRAPAAAIRSFAGGTERSASYRDCVTTVARAGNFLRHLGVRGPEGAVSGRGGDGGDDATDDGDDGRARRTVAVAPDPLPEPLFAFLGAAAVGAVVSFDPDASDDPRVVVVAAADEGRYDPSPGTRLAVYGGEPVAPGTAHWEAEVWSENPSLPPSGVAPDDPVLAAGAGAHTHAELLAAARTAADRLGLGPGDEVAVRASLADPRTVVAGVLTPLFLGGVVVLPDDEPRAGVAIGAGPEPRAVPLDHVPL